MKNQTDPVVKDLTNWINRSAGQNHRRISEGAANAKPWEANKVFDTMAHWAGVGNRVSLEKLCIALSIESPKTGLDGSKVAAAVAAGRLDDVAIYCAGDVEAVRRVFNRLTFAAPARDAIRQATGTFLIV